MNLDTLTYNHKTWDHSYIFRPTLSLPTSWPRSSITGSAWLERSIPFRSSLYGEFLRLRLTDYSKESGNYWPPVIYFFLRQKRENMPVKNVMEYCQDTATSCKRIVCVTWDVCFCERVTFLSDGAPDGDNEDADDGENQQCQNATYHCVWYCTVSLHHCTGICKRNKRDTQCVWLECVVEKKENMEIKWEKSTGKEIESKFRNESERQKAH